jgi:GR25 family glycosyltransferase involved in LPS biosynthesis
VTIDDVFGHKVCINLDRRPERWERVQARFAAHGIGGVERVSAVDGNAIAIPVHWRHTNGAYGCLRSHLQVVTEARRRGAESVLIFEDDVVFDDALQQKFAAAIENLPADWDMLYFGALHKDEPVPVTDALARLTRSNSTYAYALRNSVFDAFIELNERAADVLDNNSFDLQQRFNCLCFLPHLAWVENDWSDAQTKIEQHWYLQESLVLFGAGADRLLADTTIVFAYDGSGHENLDYLMRYYTEFFAPHIEIVVERSFEEGLRRSNRRFAVLSDSDIWLETLDFRANLRMCERYASATGFSTIIELTAEESRRLRETNTTRGLTSAKPSAPAPDRPGQCRFVNRSSQATPPFRVFQSPNHALRLQ